MRCVHGRTDEESCLPCAMAGVGKRPEESIAVLAERARCRAIVLRLFGSDWGGNQALAEIDSPGVP